MIKQIYKPISVSKTTASNRKSGIQWQESLFEIDLEQWRFSSQDYCDVMMQPITDYMLHNTYRKYNNPLSLRKLKSPSTNRTV